MATFVDLQGGSVSWGSVQEDSLRCRLKVGLCRDMFSIIVVAIVSPVHAGVQGHQDVDITCVQSFVYRLYLNKAKKTNQFPRNNENQQVQAYPVTRRFYSWFCTPKKFPASSAGNKYSDVHHGVLSGCRALEERVGVAPHH